MTSVYRLPPGSELKALSLGSAHQASRRMAFWLMPLETPPVVVSPILPDTWNEPITDPAGILEIAGKFGLQGAVL